MNFLGLFFLIVMHFLSGRGLIQFFKIKNKPLSIVAISMLTGVVLLSFLPLLLAFFYIPITATSIVIAILISTAALNIPHLKKYDYSVFKRLTVFRYPPLYELLFIVVLGCLMLPSLWRCFYLPPQARDVLSGPEAIAEFTVREHTMINSVFTVELSESVPNLLKPPFITDLQIIYKLLVHPFGQIWLSILVISFLVWLYVLLREKLHPLIAGSIMMVFMSMPDPYAYTYIILWDYSNMVYFFAGFYFLYSYVKTREYNLFLFSCLMFGFSTFIRLETILYIGMTTPLLALYFWKDKISITKSSIRLFLFLAIPMFFYYIWVGVFVKYYLPVKLDMQDHINFSNGITPYLDWFNLINSKLLFGGININVYGLMNYFFVAVLLIDLILFRSFNMEARFMLYGIIMVYLCLPLLVYLTPWFNETTAKRGIYKVFPLVVLYMRNSGLMSYLSTRAHAFEYALPTAGKVVGATTKEKPKKKT